MRLLSISNMALYIMTTLDIVGNFYSYLTASAKSNPCMDSAEHVEPPKKSMEEDPANKKTIISKDIQEIIEGEDFDVEGVSITENHEDGKEGFDIAISLTDTDTDCDKVSKILSSRIKHKGYDIDADRIVCADGMIIVFVETGCGKEKGPAEDDIQDVTRLKNLYRANRIDKNQYVGGIASLYSAGILTSSQFNRLTKGL